MEHPATYKQFPRMVYHTSGTHKIVKDMAALDAARNEGFLLTPPPPPEVVVEVPVDNTAILLAAMKSGFGEILAQLDAIRKSLLPAEPQKPESKPTPKEK